MTKSNYCIYGLKLLLYVHEVYIEPITKWPCRWLTANGTSMDPTLLYMIPVVYFILLLSPLDKTFD